MVLVPEDQFQVQTRSRQEPLPREAVDDGLARTTALAMHSQEGHALASLPANPRLQVHLVACDLRERRAGRWFQRFLRVAAAKTSAASSGFLQGNAPLRAFRSADHLH